MSRASGRVIAEALMVSCLVAAAPGVAMSLIERSPGPVAVFLAVVLLHAVTIALPAYLLLRRLGSASTLSCATVGFLSGALPVSIAIFPHDEPMSGHWSASGGTAMIIDGVHTPAAWWSYVATALFFGAIGALAGLSFWKYISARVRDAA